jgi:hypothetical protein
MVLLSTAYLPWYPTRNQKCELPITKLTDSHSTLQYQRGIQVLEMNSLFSIFHRKSPGHGRDEDGAKNKAEALPQQPEPPMDTGAKQPTTLSALQPAFPHYAPGTGPVAHAQMVQANNIGMVGGAILGSATGGNPVMGMIEGQVGANMVMQRVQQEQKHLYYREQALRYRDGLPADGVGPAGGLALPSQSAGAGRDRSRSRSQRRDERRRKRWERRAKRRDGGGGVVGNEGSSGSDSD